MPHHPTAITCSTGLPGAGELVGALDEPGPGPRVLDVVSLGAFQPVAMPLWVLGPDAGPALGAAVRRIAGELGGQGYLVGEGAIAVLARPWVLEGAVGTRLEAALRERLPGYCETMLQARVALPGEPGDGAEALRLAFRRLAARAAGHHRSPEAQVRDVLLQLLTERAEQGCAIRRTAVVANAVAIARRMHFERGELEQLIRAAELQDVGLVGLGTDGPLTAAERSRIREHPLLAQRIVGAAPSLVRAAAIIRSCYERYDGTGTPMGSQASRSRAAPASSRSASPSTR